MTEEPTVLVVDDDRPIADGFATILDEEYEVLTAYDGEKARELFERNPDVVLLDRHLPDACGDDLLEEVRERGYDCRVAIVSAAEKSTDLNCDAYLTKPLSEVDTVRETVADLLDGNVST